MPLAKFQRRLTRHRAKRALRGSNLDLRNLYKHVAVFPASQFVYNRIKKCANTRLAAFFTDITPTNLFPARRK